jgi:hypothetical protein
MTASAFILAVRRVKASGCSESRMRSSTLLGMVTKGTPAADSSSWRRGDADPRTSFVTADGFKPASNRFMKS